MKKDNILCNNGFTVFRLVFDSCVVVQ